VPLTKRSGKRFAIPLAALLIIAVTAFVMLSFADKVRACSDLRGTLEISPRGTWAMCRLPDGRAIAI